MTPGAVDRSSTVHRPRERRLRCHRVVELVTQGRGEPLRRILVHGREGRNLQMVEQMAKLVNGARKFRTCAD